jgi:PAS domain S-box-containing protein
MKDQDKTKEQLIVESEELRRRVTALEGVEIQGKRAEEEVRHSRTILSEAEKLSHTGAWEWDLCTNQWTFSDEWLSIHGCHRRTLTPEELLSIAHPDDREAIAKAFEEVRNGVTPYEMEHRIIRQDTGEVRIVKGRGQYVLDSAGKVTRVYGFVLDITEHKQAEEALRQSEERFRAFMNNSPALAWMKDQQGRHVYVNAPHEKRFGRLEDKQGKTDFDLWPRETAEQFWKNDQAVLAGNTVMEVIEEMADPDGGRTYWWNFKFPFEDASGKRYVGGVGVDITARKRAEEALQKAHDGLEQKVQERTAELAIFKNFAEASGLGFGMTGLDGRIAYVNSAWLRLVGESRVEDVIGKHISTYCPKDYWERRDTEVVPALLQTGLWQGEFALVSRDGRIIPAIHSLFPIRDQGGNLVQLGAVVTDITERKRAEEALRRSEERYELAVRGAGVGIWDWDIRTGKVYYSPRWKMLFGYDENDISDSVDDWARLLHPDERDWMLKFLEDFLAGTSPTVTVEYRLRHKDGSYRWIVATGLVVRDEQGKAYRFVGSHADITDRKRAEEALEREHKTLKHLLQSSDHERQLIAYEIHDGLAQQLAAAIMQFDAFDHLKETNPKPAADAYHAAMTMLRQGHFEARRLIAGVRPPILDEAGIVAAISHLVNEKKRQKGSKIEYLSKVEFDRLAPILENAIYRIVQEALTNACRYSKSKKVHVELVQRGDRIHIAVRDQGIGFDSARIEENQFGLAGIRERARLLGGTATVESAPGKGTQIAVELPVIVAN